jgi:hypothetical protein
MDGDQTDVLGTRSTLPTWITADRHPPCTDPPLCAFPPIFESVRSFRDCSEQRLLPQPSCPMFAGAVEAASCRPASHIGRRSLRAVMRWNQCQPVGMARATSPAPAAHKAGCFRPLGGQLRYRPAHHRHSARNVSKASVGSPSWSSPAPIEPSPYNTEARTPPAQAAIARDHAHDPRRSVMRQPIDHGIHNCAHLALRHDHDRHGSAPALPSAPQAGRREVGGQSGRAPRATLPSPRGLYCLRVNVTGTFPKSAWAVLHRDHVAAREPLAVPSIFA